MARTGGSRPSASRSGGGARSGSRAGARSGGTYARSGGSYGGRYGGHHGGGHNSFYFSPYGFGYGYYGGGFSLRIGAPFYPYYGYYGYYDYYDYYGGPYYSTGYYVDDYAVDTYAVDTYMDDTYVAVEGAVIATNAQAAEFQLAAEQAFREGRYEDAARSSNHAIVEDGENGKLHLFASQVLFALGEYPSAAAALAQGVSLLERKDWGFVVANYKRFYGNDDYVTQMETLVAFLKENPDAAFGHLVRGYHYTFLGYENSARKVLAKAVALESRDRLAAELLVMVGGEAPVQSPSEELPPPSTSAPAVLPTAAAKP